MLKEFAYTKPPKTVGIRPFDKKILFENVDFINSERRYLERILNFEFRNCLTEEIRPTFFCRRRVRNTKNRRYTNHKHIIHLWPKRTFRKQNFQKSLESWTAFTPHSRWRVRYNAIGKNRASALQSLISFFLSVISDQWLCDTR